MLPNVEAFHKFQKMSLDNNCRKNYINKLKEPNGSLKGKFGELKVRINDNKLLTNLNEEGHIDTFNAELNAEEHLEEDRIYIKEELFVPEDNTNLFYQKIIKEEIEPNNVNDRYRFINIGNQIIVTETQSNGQELKINENELLTNLKHGDIIYLNVEEPHVVENLVINEIGIKEQFSISEDNTNPCYQQMLKTEKEPNNVLDSDGNIDQIRPNNEEFKNENNLLTNLQHGESIDLNIECKKEEFTIDENKLLSNTIVEESNDFNNMEQDAEENFVRYRNIKDNAIQSSKQKVIENISKKYICLVCDQVFSEKALIQKHIIIHASENNKKCDKLFMYKRLLNNQMKFYARKNHWKCPICNKKLTSKGNLNIHLRLHTGQKDYKCSICNKMFSRNSNLKQHMATHTGIKDFQCSICNKMFTTNFKLKHHMVTHTGMKDHKCSVCNKMFIHKSSLKSHMQRHTS